MMSFATDTHTSSSPSARAARGASLLFVSQFAGYAFFFLSQRTILSSLSKDDYGALAFVQQTCSLVLVVLADGGLNNVTIREALHHPEKERDILSASLWLRLIGTTIGCLIIALFFLSTDAHLLTIAVTAAVSVVVSGRTAMLRSSLEMPMRVRTNFAPVAILFVLDAALYAMLLWLYPGSLSAQSVISMQLIATIPSLMFVVLRTKVLRYVIPLPPLSEIKALLRTTRSVVVQLLLQNIHAGIDVFALRFLTSLRELAVFGAVANMSMVVITIYTALSTALYPLLAEVSHSNDEILRNRVVRSLSMVSFVCIMAAAMLSTASPLIVEVFTKNVYADSVRAFQLQFWCSVAIVISQFALVMNTVMKQHRAVIVSGIMLVMGSLVFDFLLIPGYGTNGMLAAKTFSNIISAGVSLWYVRDRLGATSIMSIVRRIMVVSLVLCPLSVVSTQTIGLIPATVLVVVSGLFLGWWTQMISITDVHELRRSVPFMKSHLRPQRNAQD